MSMHTEQSLESIAHQFGELNSQLSKILHILEEVAAKITVEKVQVLASALVEMLDEFIPENMKPEEST